MCVSRTGVTTATSGGVLTGGVEMRTPMTRVIVFLYLLAGVAPAAVAQVDQQCAQEFFKEAQALCERDGGRLSVS